MSERPLTEAESTLTCEFCDAQPGERCVNPDGSFYGSGVHMPRRRDREDMRTDEDGCTRVRGRLGTFTIAEDAEKSARSLTRQHLHTGWRTPQMWYIWRFADGTFDYTAVLEPAERDFPAELVGRVQP